MTEPKQEHSGFKPITQGYTIAQVAQSVRIIWSATGIHDKKTTALDAMCTVFRGLPVALHEAKSVRC